MGKLAKALNISLSTLSRQLQQKKTKSLIEITRSEKDSSKIVKLSLEGIKKAEELKNTLSKIESLLFISLDSDASSLFVKQLYEIAQASSSLNDLQ